MYRIQLNPSGTRHLDIDEKHLHTIERFNLFRDLIDSNGYVDEAVLEKLRQTVRGLILAQCPGCDELFDLCVDVLYHDRMKNYGLHRLILLYVDWKDQQSQDN